MALIPVKKKQLAAEIPDANLGKRSLGEGGNGRVYPATHKVYGKVAIKFFLNDEVRRRVRFEDEVRVVTERLKGSPRVLPILDYCLPDVSTGKVPWYVMPAAETLRDVLKGLGWRQMLPAFIELADGLAEIHERGVAHRDVKPENVFRHAGAYCFGDFGIAAFPERQGVTKEDEPMGPATFLAPEMETNAGEAEPFSADVYSLAKSLWAMLAGQKFAFPGQYSPSGIEGLLKFAEGTGFFLEPLEALLVDATSSHPPSRPTAAEFSARLKEVAVLQYDFDKANPLQWEFANQAALQRTGVARAEWTSVESIAEVVGLLSRHRGMNHCFFPEGGGMHVTGASLREGGQLLALHLPSGGPDYILKPIKLTLECFPDHPEFGYAVLEAGEVERLTQGSRYIDGPVERLRTLNEFDYVVNDTEQEQPRYLGVGEACERRFMGGFFVIAPTRGIYNAIDDYMGTAQRVGVEGLKREFARLLDSSRGKRTESRWLEPIVRLQPEGVSRVTFELSHLTQDLLWELVDCDDELLDQRKQTSGEIVYPHEIVARISAAAADPLRITSLKILKSLSRPQQGEYMALVDVGRNNCVPAEFHERVELHAHSDWEATYLLEKLGNGYIRKAFKRFGLKVVEPGPRPRF